MPKKTIHTRAKLLQERYKDIRLTLLELSRASHEMQEALDILDDHLARVASEAQLRMDIARVHRAVNDLEYRLEKIRDCAYR